VSAGTIAPPRPTRRTPRRNPFRDREQGPPPPEGGGGGDGDGGGRELAGGDGGDRARLGLVLALLGMSTLFVVFLVASLLLRRNAPSWPPPGAPVPPRGLWISTLVILASSATFVLATRAREALALRRWLAITLDLGVVFLVVQALLWRTVFASGRFTFSDAYGTIFYSLTGLHAAHVIGGLVFLFRTLRRARRDATAPRTRVAVSLCSTYWHFMGGVWVVVFVVLEFLS